MLNERILNLVGGVLLFVMMFYIMNGLAKQFDPQPLINHYAHPSYTQSSYEDMKRELTYYKKSFKDLDAILEGK